MIQIYFLWLQLWDTFSYFNIPVIKSYKVKIFSDFIGGNLKKIREGNKSINLFQPCLQQAVTVKPL